MELLVALLPFAAMALTLLGIWAVVRRGDDVRPRWGVVAAVAVVLLGAWLVLAPASLSTTERLLTGLPAAGFVLLAPWTLALLQQIAKRQRD